MWPNILRDGDPFYNINFAREGKQFTLPEITPSDLSGNSTEAKTGEKVNENSEDDIESAESRKKDGE